MLTNEELERLQTILMHDKPLYSEILEILDDYDKLCDDYDDLMEKYQEYEEEEYKEMEGD